MNPVFDKESRNTRKWNGKKKKASTTQFWSYWKSACRKMQINPALSPCTKLSSKQIKAISIKPDTLNLIVEKVGDSFECIWIGDNFLNRTLILQAQKSQINKWKLMKLKASIRKRTQSNRQSDKLQNWENDLGAPHLLDI